MPNKLHDFSNIVMRSTALAAVLVVGLMSAASAESKAPATDNATSATDSAVPKQDYDEKIASMLPKEIRDKGYVNVASSPTQPAFIVSSDGKTYGGSDYALGQALSEVLGIEFRWEAVPFDQIIPGLKSNRYDLALSSMGINPKRRKEVIFVSYVKTRVGFLGAKGSGHKVDSFEDTCGMTVSVTTGSVTEMMLNKANETTCADNPMVLSRLINQSAVELAAISGRVQLATGRLSSVSWRAQRDDSVEVAGYVDVDDGRGAEIPAGLQGMAIPRTEYGQQFAEALAAAVNKLYDNGSLKTIMGEWANAEGFIDQAEIKVYP